MQNLPTILIPFPLSEIYMGGYGDNNSKNEASSIELAHCSALELYN